MLDNGNIVYLGWIDDQMGVRSVSKKLFWTEAEAAIVLHSFLVARKSRMTDASMIALMMEDLRGTADRDDIEKCIRRIECLLGKNNGMNRRVIPRTFVNVVEMYQKYPDDYADLLEKSMQSETSNSNKSKEPKADHIWEHLSDVACQKLQEYRINVTLRLSYNTKLWLQHKNCWKLGDLVLLLKTETPDGQADHLAEVAEKFSEWLRVHPMATDSTPVAPAITAAKTDGAKNASAIRVPAVEAASAVETDTKNTNETPKTIPSAYWELVPLDQVGKLAAQPVEALEMDDDVTLALKHMNCWTLYALLLAVKNGRLDRKNQMDEKVIQKFGEWLDEHHFLSAAAAPAPAPRPVSSSVAAAEEDSTKEADATVSDAPKEGSLCEYWKKLSNVQKRELSKFRIEVLGLDKKVIYALHKCGCFTLISLQIQLSLDRIDVDDFQKQMIKDAFDLWLKEHFFKETVVNEIEKVEETATPAEEAGGENAPAIRVPAAVDATKGDKEKKARESRIEMAQGIRERFACGRAHYTAEQIKVFEQYSVVDLSVTGSSVDFFQWQKGRSLASLADPSLDDLQALSEIGVGLQAEIWRAFEEWQIVNRKLLENAAKIHTEAQKSAAVAADASDLPKAEAVRAEERPAGDEKPVAAAEAKEADEPEEKIFTPQEEKKIEAARWIKRSCAGGQKTYTPGQLEKLKAYPASQLPVTKSNNSLFRWARNRTMAAVAAPTKEDLLALSFVRDKHQRSLWNSFDHWLRGHGKILTAGEEKTSAVKAMPEEKKIAAGIIDRQFTDSELEVLGRHSALELPMEPFPWEFLRRLGTFTLCMLAAPTVEEKACFGMLDERMQIEVKKAFEKWLQDNASLLRRAEMQTKTAPVVPTAVEKGPAQKQFWEMVPAAKKARLSKMWISNQLGLAPYIVYQLEQAKCWSLNALIDRIAEDSLDLDAAAKEQVMAKLKDWLEKHGFIPKVVEVEKEKKASEPSASPKEDTPSPAAETTKPKTVLVREEKRSTQEVQKDAAPRGQSQKAWDEYESAFLLSYALKVIAGEIPKQEAVSTVSKKLRERAVAQGLVIDEIFRNENGISLQLGSMIDCYLGKDSWRTISKRFHETVELYKRDPDAIKRILQEGAAVEKPEATSGKYQDSTPQTSSAAEAGASYAAAPAKVQQPLFRDPEEERYLAVLCERFPTGCRDGILGMKRFIRAYNEKYGTSLDDSDAVVRDAVEAKLHRFGIRYKDRTFAAAALLSETGKEKLFRYIEDTFAKGVPVLYYDALFDKFDDEWTADREGITTVYLLREYLQHELAGVYHFSEPKYIAAARHAQIDIGQEVKDAMLAYGGPMQKTLLYQKLPHIPQDKIDIELHQPEYIYSNVGECFHVSLIDLSAAELAVIREMIQRELDRCRFMGGRELVRMLQKAHPEIMDRFSGYRDISLRDAIGWYLGENFSFQGNVISGKGQYLSAADVYTAFARTHDEFTLADLERVRDDFEFGNIYFYEVCCQALRISQDEFRAKSRAAFDIERTDAAIDRFCAGPYIPLRAVTDFGYFPSAGYPWNIYLLEQYVFAYSRKYKLITNGFNAYASAGVIVRRDAGLSDMESIMADALAKSGVKLMKNDILQYLQDEGYIVRKRLSQNTLTAIINKARALQRSPRP